MTHTDALVTGDSAPSVTHQRRRPMINRCRHFVPVLALVVLMFIYFSITQPDFASKANLVNLLTTSAPLWIASMGMTFVLISQGIDLSMGAMSAFVGILLAKLLGVGIPGGLAVCLAIVGGGAVGAVINGMFIARGLSFFVVTLASLTALTGVANLWSHTHTFFVTAPFVGDLAINHILGIQTPIWIMAGTFVGALFVESRTRFGRDIYAVGGSRIAARLSGIRTSRTLIGVYALSGALVALAGILSVGQDGIASPTVDTELPLNAAAAVLLGGTSLTGGAGGVGGTVFGVLFIGVLQNGLSLAGIASAWQEIVTGIILVSAVLGDRLSLRDLRRWRTIVANRGRVNAQTPPGESGD